MPSLARHNFNEKSYVYLYSLCISLNPFSFVFDKYYTPYHSIKV